MYSSARARRVITAFINCVNAGQFSEDYATTLIEDSARYGFLAEGDKELFYSALETPAAEDGGEAI